MEIHWKSDKLRNDLQNLKLLRSRYGVKVAESVAIRLREIGMFPSYADLPLASRKHPLYVGKKIVCFSVDLPEEGKGRGKWRLLFKPLGEYDLTDLKTITSVEILEIKDPH